jgi:DNA-binding LytR/AlgR family response regulator
MDSRFAASRSFEHYPDYEVLENLMQDMNRKLFLKKGNAHIAINLRDIICFYYDSKIVFALVKNGSKYITEKNLTELQQQLHEKSFFRVNRRCIINGNFIRNFKTVNQVKVQVEMEFGSKEYQVLVSQKRVASFRKWVYTL